MRIINKNITPLSHVAMIVSCRFGISSQISFVDRLLIFFITVPYDQWLVTHIDPTTSIRQIKHALLAKCIDTLAHYRPSSPVTFAPYKSNRPISPIRFAKPTSFHRATLSLAIDPHPDDPISPISPISDLDSPIAVSDTTITVEQHTPPPLSHIPAPESPESPMYKHVSPEEAQILSQYAVIRFAPGQVLEDDFQAVWYSIRPHELLEIHRMDVVMRLPRGLSSEYAIPYFEAPVRILVLAGPSGMYHTDDDRRRTRSPPEDDKRTKGKEKDRSTDKDRTKKGKNRDPDAPAKLERPRSKRQKLEWREKWLVVRAGVIYICQDQQVHQMPHRDRQSFNV